MITNPQLHTIYSKIKTLIQKNKELVIFASKTHTYTLNPVLSEEYVQNWEEKYGVQLPQDYKDFLTQIANGGAGPYYGLYSLENGIKEAKEYAHINETEQIEDPFTIDFPVSKSEADTFVTYYYECLDDGEDDEIEFFEPFDPLTGCIFLSDYGCGWSYFLVIKGEMAGTVWFQGDYLSPCIYKNRILTFSEWYENWLDTSLQEISPKKNKKDDIDLGATILNYDGHNLKKIPEKVFECTNLKKLVLSRNSMEKFPAEILNLEHLRILDLSMTSITEIPDEIFKLSNLKKLYLNYNYILDLPAGLAKLQKMEKLSMYYNYKIEKIPEVVGAMQSLKDISFSYCSELNEIPQNIGNLINLESLYLNDCSNLNCLPESFGNLKNLKTLFLSFTKLSQLPESFSELKNLEHLAIDIETLDLEQAVEKIRHLPKLHYLKLIGQLNYPETLKYLTSVKTLLVSKNYDLSRKGHNYLPLHENLTLIPNVEILDLVDNYQVSALPENIHKWQNLTTLYLGGATAVKSFPETLKQVKNLSLVRGNLTSQYNPSFGISPTEKEKLKKWFPKAKIEIW
jgi:hypothetical protein